MVKEAAQGKMVTEMTPTGETIIPEKFEEIYGDSIPPEDLTNEK